MKPTAVFDYLYRYRMPFKRWLWLGAGLWILTLIALMWLFNVNSQLNVVKGLAVISALALVLLYQFVTIRYFTNILFRLHCFLKATREHRTTSTTEHLIEDGEVGALFKDLQQTTLALEQFYQHADTVAQQQQMLSEAVKQSTNSIVITDLQHNILFVNQAFCHVSGYTTAEIIGKTPKILQSGKTPETTYIDIRHALAKGNAWSGELTNKSKNGDLINEHITIMPIKNTQGEIWRFMAIKENITAIKRAEQHIHSLAFTDNITKLANRHSLLQQFEKWQERNFAILLININNFKQINNQYGLVAGDKLLISFATKLKSTLPADCFIARLNSDEFVVLLPDCNIATLTTLYEQQLHLLQGEITAGILQTTINCRFGACIYPQHGKNISDLLTNADMASRRAKHSSKKLVIFQSAMKLEYEKQMKQLSILRQELLKPTHLSLVVQPQIELKTNSCIGAEVLLRLNHPDSPNNNIYSFILLAEHYGLIKKLDQWVIKQSLLLLLELQNFKYDKKLSVNISAASFQDPDFVDFIVQLLVELSLSTPNLTLEITESALISQPHIAIKNAERLEQLGICLSIDDFGTGHSSLAYLQQFSVCQLKIDKSFIDNVTTNVKDKAIVETTLLLAKGLGLKTVAEGIENEQQRLLLLQLGCDYAQGFYFSRPITPDAFQVMLTSQSFQVSD
ncbi:hypothetical protein VT06_04015 [Arsukibacterium sp. MJ3]|nr:hypothetical protein VT06_04015 [Arsukibacterium sp. MJ3]